jgi:hypothetical protein
MLRSAAAPNANPQKGDSSMSDLQPDVPTAPDGAGREKSVPRIPGESI